jgi:enoyl-CoA hydratase/carnithine racemase
VLRWQGPTTYSEILFDPDEAGFVQGTIHRPHKPNALSNRVMAELDDAFQSVEREYRGLILTGADGRSLTVAARKPGTVPNRAGGS